MRGLRGNGLRSLVATGSVLVLLALAPGASAATRSQTGTLSTNGERLTLTPKCSNGQRATGGGFVGSPSPFIAFGQFLESRKVGQRSWRVSAEKTTVNFSTLTVTAYVYCDRDSPRTKEAATTVTVTTPGGAFDAADSNCGRSRKAQAGGFLLNTATGDGSIVDSYRVSKKTWRTRGYDEIGFPTLTNYVYCADADSPKARSGSTSSSLHLSPATAISAECKPGTHVGAGGFSQPNAALGKFLYPYESFRTRKSWRVSMWHVQTGATTLNAIAYCV